MLCICQTLYVCLKMERPCQAFLAWSFALPLSLSVFPLLCLIHPSPSPSPLQPLSNSALSISLFSFFLALLPVCMIVLLFSALHSFMFLIYPVFLLTLYHYKGESWSFSTLQYGKFCSVSALNCSQCCTVMQTCMRAVRGTERKWLARVKRMIQGCREMYRSVRCQERNT